MRSISALPSTGCGYDMTKRSDKDREAYVEGIRQKHRVVIRGFGKLSLEQQEGVMREVEKVVAEAK